MLAKLTSIMDNPSHPLNEIVAALSSSFSDRLLHPQCKKEPQVLHPISHQTVHHLHTVYFNMKATLLQCVHHINTFSAMF